MRGRTTLVAVLAVGALVTAGCGDSGSGSDPTKDDPVKITVANLAVTNSAGLVLGVKKGFFSDVGLDVEIKDTPAASTVPAVVSNDAQFAFTGVPPLINARANDLPIKAVAPAAGYPTDLAQSQIQLVAAQGSSLTSVQDVEGKKIAVDTLYQLPHLSLIQALQTEGIDTSTIKFVEVPYPAMADALSSGAVDAADFGDPFLSQALAAGGVPLISNGTGFDPGVTQVLWVTSESYISKNPEVVKAFAEAVEKSNAYAAEHLDEVREIVPSYMKGTDEIASKLLLPQYTTTIDDSTFDVYNDLMVGLDLIKEPVSPSDAIYKP